MNEKEAVEVELTKRELQEQRSALIHLTESQGWQYLESLMYEQLETRQNHRLGLRMTSRKQVAEFERTAGEEDGIRLAMNLPRVLIEELEVQIKES